MTTPRAAADVVELPRQDSSIKATSSPIAKTKGLDSVPVSPSMSEDTIADSSSPEVHIARFDWRRRAPSRLLAQASARASANTSSEPQPGPAQPVHIRRFLPPHVDVGLGEPYFDAINTYQNHFLPLLGAEQAEDEAVLQNRLATWGVERLKADGYCLTELSAFWLDATQFGKPVASFLLGPGINLPEHRFDNGTEVLISRFDPLQEEPKRGSVIGKTSSQIKILFEDIFDLSDGTWRLDLGRSNIVFSRMRAAIQSLHHDPAAQEAMHPPGSDRQIILSGTYLRDILLRTFAPSDHPHPHVPLQSPDDVSYVSHEKLDHELHLAPDEEAPKAPDSQPDGEIAGQHHSTVEPLAVTHPTDGPNPADPSFWDGAFKEDMRIQSWARRYSQTDPIVIEGDPVLSLNSTQIRAMAMMIGQRASLVQGPPGTGKTKTIIETIKLLKLHFEVPHPLLVCTYTNVAVDNLVEGFATSGLKPLRVGYAGKIRTSLEKFSLDYQIDAHPLKPELVKLSRETKEVEKQVQGLLDRLDRHKKKYTGPRAAETQRKMGWALVSLERRLNSLRSQSYKVYLKVLYDVVGQADVICTTCISSACVALKATDFPVVFVDEASMSTEPASLIPLMKGSQHVALIGDHKQLPPIITSKEAQANGLALSLFERLTEEGVVPSIMLDTQYRMHPGISAFPSREFYNFKLLDGTIDSVGNIAPSLSPPVSQHIAPQEVKSGRRPPVIFLDHTGAESQKDRSRINLNEAHIICSVVEDLLLNNPELRGSDIGIIAPYVAQVSLLTRLLNSDSKYQDRFRNVLGDSRILQLGSIEVKTVDGFEGREKAVIIFSTVRNNAGGYIGFLADRRRLNVGLTRAKRGLFVVGSLDTLRTGRTASSQSEGGRINRGSESWRRYATYLTEQELVITLRGDNLNRVLYSNSLVGQPVGTRL